MSPTRRILRPGIALAVAGAGLVAVPLATAQAQPDPSPSAVQQMADEAQGDVKFSANDATGRVGFVRVRAGGDLMPTVTASGADAAAAKAGSYLDKYAGSFGARSGELEQIGLAPNAQGWTVTFAQSYRGVPVFGSMLKANVDRQGDLTSVNGYAAPALDLDTDVRGTRAAAAERAVSLVRLKPPMGVDGKAASLKGIKATRTTKMVYRLGSTRGETGKNIMAWVVEVSNGSNIADTVVLDANSLKAVNRWSTGNDAIDRELYSYQAGVPTKLWSEGDPFPGSLDTDQQNMVKSTGEVYSMFSAFGRDSFDDKGGTMISVHNRPDSCPNASWNGQYTSYCPGVYDDDTVAHEWGHAYTQYTSGLIYQWQSGALNESYSDVWGETVDLLNGREDENEGDLTTRRPDGLCSSHTRGAVTATIDAPASVAGPCAAAAPASFGPQFTPAGVTGTVVVATDAANDAGPSTTDGCSPFTNAAAVAGKWAFVDRGTCAFALKIQNVIAAGATGVVFGNNTTGALSVAGNYPTLTGVMVSQADGTRIKNAGGPVTLTVKEQTRDTADSYRWLLSEGSTAFGGAIRDMWNPTCYGDPGKVSDAQYHCTSDDNGGVHGNSAVPNHAYALLVDGGTFNNVTSTGIGLDKAANIYYRAMTAYLTPTSDFVDQADALEASCTDLTGKAINKVSLVLGQAPVAATPITAGDCAQVVKVNQAVEFRKDPTAECEWTPLLDKNTPSTCGEGFTDKKLWGEDFEQGLDGWVAGNQVRFTGGIHAPWTATSTAPGNRPGTVAYGPAPDAGQCTGADGDFSSVDWITSPTVAMPANGLKPRLSFKHYVATEVGFDAGNVQVSVNGGEFRTIPTAAYVFNPPTALESSDTVGGDSTNPLAGQDGFSGTDPGSVRGSWGTSIVDLAAAGVNAPGTVQFRFQVGRDGCGGVNGWYVDDIEVSVCEVATKTSAVRTPEPSNLGQASTVNVTVKNASASGGLQPRGTVEISNAAGEVLATGTVASGTPVALALPASLPAGANALTVRYLGDGKSAPSQFGLTATVIDPNAPKPPSASTTSVKVKPKKPKQGHKFTVTATVSSAVAATGTVTFSIDGRTMGTGTVKNGKATFKVSGKKAKKLRAGKHTAQASYAGSTAVAASSGTVRFRIRR